MKFSVKLKDPDRFYESVNDAIKESVADTGLPEDEQEALSETRREKAWKCLGQWVEYQEYITIDFDTEAGTATVRRRS